MCVESLTYDNGRLNDCWNRIGVWGNGECPELKKALHCHNCTVYSAAAAHLLEQELPEGYLDNWTAHFTTEAQAADEQSESALVFRIGSEWLALPPVHLQEIVEDRPIHSVPHLRKKILLGLVNIRGELLICVTLDELLTIERGELLPPSQSLGGTLAASGALPPAKGHRAGAASLRDFRGPKAFQQNPRSKSSQTVCQRLIVANREGSRFVFPVDEVQGIHRFSPKELKEVPATLARARATFTRGILHWQSKTVGCLDEQLLFDALDRSLV
jgi:chemotaxis-related protein WspD